MNQYLVAIHYIQLLQAELNILNRDARLLFDLKIDPNLAKRELADLKVSLSKLSDKNLYIEGTIWYQPSLFVMDPVQPEKSELLQRLQQLDIDSMTPREALDCLYELKKLSNEID